MTGIAVRLKTRRKELIKMNRYEVKVSIFVDADTDDEADDLVSGMLAGTETMSRMWQVNEVEKKWVHET
jgi:hypothetical protein